MIQNAQTGLEISDAVDELLKWDAVTAVGTLDATPEQVYEYLQAAAARHPGSAEPTMNDARLLSDLELTVSLGAPEGETPLNDLGTEDPLNGAMTVNFGGRDVTGVKQLDDQTYARVGAQAVVEDVYGADEAAVAEAERFEEDASHLPEALSTAASALRGDWVRVEPFEYDAYAEALTAHAGVPRATADALAAALIDGGSLLTPEALWDSLSRLDRTLRAGADLDPSGQDRGADIVAVRLSAGDAYEAVEPLLALVSEQGERFGLPPLVSEPADPAAPVTAELAIRNGALTDVTFDLAQLTGEEGAGNLPLNLLLAGGSALNLDPPETDPGILTPDDLSVALLYLAEQNERRAEDESRADVPGPMQP